MAVGSVTVIVGGVKLLLATEVDYDGKWANESDDTFDGIELNQGDVTYTVKVTGIYTYNTKFETLLAKALALTNTPDGLPITVVDNNLTIQCTGCIIETLSYKRTPKSKATRDFSFTAKTLVESWK
jgi:hypothetical protein